MSTIEPKDPEASPGEGENPAPRGERRALLGELVRFCLVGAANAVLDLGLFNLLYLALDTPALLAKVLASSVATVSSYLCNRRWTFRRESKQPHRRAVGRFLGVNVLGFGVSLLPLVALERLVAEPTLLALNLAGGAGIGLGAVVRFVGYRSVVFSERKASAEA